MVYIKLFELAAYIKVLILNKSNCPIGSTGNAHAITSWSAIHIRVFDKIETIILSIMVIFQGIISASIFVCHVYELWINSFRPREYISKQYASVDIVCSITTSVPMDVWQFMVGHFPELSICSRTSGDLVYLDKHIYLIDVSRSLQLTFMYHCEWVLFKNHLGQVTKLWLSCYLV